MSKVYPYYPKPAKNKISSFMTIFKKNRSWLDGLYEKSYTMYLGEVTLPNLKVFMPNDPTLIHKVLVSDVKNFPKNSFLHEVLVPLLGDSIFTTNGEVWRKQRDLLTPSFENINIANVFNLMNEASKDMLERLSNLEKNKYHNIDEEMTFVTADIIFRTILSKKLSKEKAIEIVNAFVVFQEKSASYAMSKMFFLSKFYKLFGADKKRIATGEVIRKALGDIIEPRHKEVEEGKEAQYFDILSTLLKVKDKDTNKPFSSKEILDQIAMLFLAGHETTASSMTWALYLLALYPKEQERAYNEVITICKDEEFRVDTIKSLTFVTNVFKETLRLYPPVSFMPREAKIDTTMRDKKIKKGDSVVISPWLIQRNEKFWEDPHYFNPNRFNKEITKDTYFPFGLGQRICIGANFAMQESVLLLASILREYRLELKPSFTPDIVGRLTTRSLNGMPIKLIKRG